jgi:hypothetical protein
MLATNADLLKGKTGMVSLQDELTDQLFKFLFSLGQPSVVAMNNASLIISQVDEELSKNEYLAKIKKIKKNMTYDELSYYCEINPIENIRLKLEKEYLTKELDNDNYKKVLRELSSTLYNLYNIYNKHVTIGIENGQITSKQKTSLIKDDKYLFGSIVTKEDEKLLKDKNYDIYNLNDIYKFQNELNKERDKLSKDAKDIFNNFKKKYLDKSSFNDDLNSKLNLYVINANKIHNLEKHNFLLENEDDKLKIESLKNENEKIKNGKHLKSFNDALNEVDKYSEIRNEILNFDKKYNRFYGDFALFKDVFKAIGLRAEVTAKGIRGREVPKTYMDLVMKITTDDNCTDYLNKVLNKEYDNSLVSAAYLRLLERYNSHCLLVRCLFKKEKNTLKKARKVILEYNQNKKCSTQIGTLFKEANKETYEHKDYLNKLNKEILSQMDALSKDIIINH